MKNILIILISTLILACESFPSEPKQDTSKISAGAYVLCEGLMGRNNTSIVRYDFAEGVTVNNYFSKINSGLNLGDTGNDLVRFGDTAFVAVTISNTIEAFQISTGKWVGRIIFNGNPKPRQIAILNAEKAYVTLQDADKIVEFNPTLIQLTERELQVGAAPEGITVLENNIYVVNSGFGDYRQHHSNASTLMKIDANSLTITNKVKTGVNPQFVKSDIENKSVIISYRNLASLTLVDSTGGLEIYNAETLEKNASYSMEVVDFDISNPKYIYFASSNSLVKLNTASHKKDTLYLRNSKYEYFYGIKYNKSKNEIWVCDALDYQRNGKVNIFDEFGNLLKVFTTDVNPSRVIFF